MMWIASSWPLGCDEADARALFLDDGVRADRRAVGEERDVAAELAERQAEGLGARAERVHHPAREISGVDGTLVVRSLPARSTIAQSVKVPPISMPTR
jgi:hypothetical protein